MPRKPSIQPNDVELAILRVLWTRGPSTAREVHVALSVERSAGYSTTTKMMQVMYEKGLLVRDESVRPQLYKSAVPAAQAQRRIVGDLIHRVFGGSAKSLMVRAVESQAVSPEELVEIRKVLDRIEKKGRKP